MKKIKQLLIALLLLVSAFTHAQVTTSLISGRVTDGKEPLIGASVVATHQPSGTRYGVITNTDGYYTIQGLRAGGPYSVEVTYVGYTKSVFDNIALHLGDNYPLNVTMQETSNTLNDVVVTAVRVTERAGTNTDISSRQIESLPTIARSINDFTRLSPYAGSSNSFAGQDGRYNNITIDGAAFNNNFGLSSNNLPGGDSQPISLDAIQEISVNVAPYDITQSSFTGASVNAVTRSGDNTFKGTAYTYLRPGSFTGNHVGDVQIANANSTAKQTYGLSLGGPILKNKLFFFVNGEFENKTYPSGAYTPSGNGTGNAANLTARTSPDSLKMVKDYLMSKYGYDAGSYDNFGNFNSQNYKVLGRVDWNINDNNKLTVRFNYVNSQNDVLTNANSGPGTLTRPSARIGVNSVAFSNSFYKLKDVVSSITGELNSTFSSQWSNKFLASYTHIQDTRTTPSAPFPFVDIWSNIDGVNDNYMSFGYELFSYNNNVLNNTLNITDKVSVNIGANTLTGGISYDQYYFFNSYMREGTSYYRYASVSDFLNDATPTGFGYVYGYNGQDAPGAALTFGMGSVFLQDEYKLSQNVKINGGIRLEQPFYLNKLQTNPAIDALSFVNGYQMRSGSWPSPKPTIAPRIGFTADVFGNRSLIIRGGTGIFSGLLPFVWFTNQPTNAGMIQSPEVSWTAAQCQQYGLKFDPNYKNLTTTYADQLPNTPGVLPSGAGICEVGKTFKMPQVWRSSIAADIKLPEDIQWTVEGMYTKDINAVVQKNVNLPDAQTTFTGPDTRQRWTSKTVNSNYGTAMVLDNTNQGYSYSFSTQLKKTFNFGLSASLAYTYTMSKDATSNPGSSASSAWASNTAVNNLNDPGLSYSYFAVPNRVVGTLSYKISYAKHFASTFSLLYNGAPQGRKNFTFQGDMNGDGNASDLLYIPTKAQLDDGSFKFVDVAYKDMEGNNQTFTAQDQASAFWNYIQGNSYLKSRVGKYVDRFGYVMPWVHDFDFKFLEDIYTNFGKHKYTLQLSFDVMNVGNLLKSTWGTYKTMSCMSYDNIQLLTPKGADANGLPSYTLYTLNLGKNNLNPTQNFIANSSWINNPSTANTWSAMLGIRLLF